MGMATVSHRELGSRLRWHVLFWSSSSLAWLPGCEHSTSLYLLSLRPYEEWRERGVVGRGGEWL